MKAKGIAGAWLALALWAAAGEDIENKTIDALGGGEAAARTEAPGSDLLRPLGVTLVLIGAAGGLYVLGRRFTSKRPFLHGRNIKVLETAYLSPKHTVMLVRVRNRILLLGLGQDIRPIATFDQPDDVLGFDGAFKEELRSAIGEESPRAGSTLEPYRQQIDRLKQAVGRWRGRLKGEVPR